MILSLEFDNEDQASAVLAWLRASRCEAKDIASRYPYDRELQTNAAIEIAGLDRAIDDFTAQGVEQWVGVT